MPTLLQSYNNTGNDRVMTVGQSFLHRQPRKKVRKMLKSYLSVEIEETFWTVDIVEFCETHNRSVYTHRMYS